MGTPWLRPHDTIEVCIPSSDWYPAPAGIFRSQRRSYIC